METWKATIKEKDNDKLVTPSYMLANMFDHIKDEMQKEHEIRKFLVGFWGLNKPDVEWYKLEKVED